MVGGKRGVEADTGLEELATGIIECGPFAPRGDLENLIDGEAVDHGFTSNQSGLLGVRVMMEKAKAIEGDRSGNKDASEAGRGCIGMVVGGVVEEVMPHEVPVFRADCAGGGDEEKTGGGLTFAQTEGTSPDGGLVAAKVLGKVAESYRVGRGCGSVRQRGCGLSLGDHGGGSNGQKQSAEISTHRLLYA